MSSLDMSLYSGDPKPQNAFLIEFLSNNKNDIPNDLGVQQVQWLLVSNVWEVKSLACTYSHLVYPSIIKTEKI